MPSLNKLNLNQGSIEMMLPDNQVFKGRPQDALEIMRLNQFQPPESQPTPETDQNQPFIQGNENPVEARERFSQSLAKQIGIDPRYYNPSAEAEKLYQERLPVLFTHIFKGKQYGQTLTPEEQKYFNTMSQRLFQETSGQVNDYYKYIAARFQTGMQQFEDYLKHQENLRIRNLEKEKVSYERQKDREEQEYKASQGKITLLREINKNMLEENKDLAGNARGWLPPFTKIEEGKLIDAQGKIITQDAFRKLWEEERTRRLQSYLGNVGVEKSPLQEETGRGGGALSSITQQDRLGPNEMVRMYDPKTGIERRLGPNLEIIREQKKNIQNVDDFRNYVASLSPEQKKKTLAVLQAADPKKYQEYMAKENETMKGRATSQAPLQKIGSIEEAENIFQTKQKTLSKLRSTSGVEKALKQRKLKEEGKKRFQVGKEKRAQDVKDDMDNELKNIIATKGEVKLNDFQRLMDKYGVFADTEVIRELYEKYRKKGLETTTFGLSKLSSY